MPLKFFAPKNQLDAIKIKGFGENLAPKRTLEQEYTCDDSVILDGSVGLSVGEPSEPSARTKGRDPGALVHSYTQIRSS